MFPVSPCAFLPFIFPPLHGIRPFFSFARQQVLLPRKAFWGIACALALRGDLCYPAREVIFTKILMINGSPHPRGCTYTALHEMERVLRAAGAEVQILTVGAEQMGGCVACGGCRATGRCVRGGLVNDAIDAMETADALVLASPVHYAGISGAMSAFCDRLFYASDGWANKPCACVVSARRAGTTAALDQLVKYPMISNMPVVSSQYWPMVHGACPEDAAQDAEGLQTMRQLARNLLWLVRCIDAGDAAGVARPETEVRTFTNFIR